MGQNDEDDDCAFCLGRAAAHRREAEDTNPFTPTGAVEGSVDWHSSDHGLWLAGHRIGAKERGSMPWYAQDGADE